MKSIPNPSLMIEEKNFLNGKKLSKRGRYLLRLTLAIQEYHDNED